MSKSSCLASWRCWVFRTKTLSTVVLERDSSLVSHLTSPGRLGLLTYVHLDSTGAPRPVVNSKGRRRRPGTKTLAQALRCDDELFVDFIAKCLVWDPERRIKPRNAMRHPFLTAGRRAKISAPAPGTAKALLASASNLSSRSKPVETPKKSQISAPTPLTARVTRTTNTVPSTPSGSTSMHSMGSARSYRTSQTQAMSSYHSSRTLNGFAVRISYSHGWFCDTDKSIQRRPPTSELDVHILLTYFTSMMTLIVHF